MSTPLSEGRHPLEFLLHQQEGVTLQKKTVTIPANTTLEPGFVLAKLSATGKFVPYDNSGGDGSEAARGVLGYELVNDTGAPVDADGVVVVCNAAVRADDLVWAAGLVDADKAAGIADLEAYAIFAR